MRRKIQEIAQGKFPSVRPTVVIPEERLIFSVMERSPYQGSFVIESSMKKVPIRGIVTCENPYVTIENSAFEGAKTTIHFTYDNSFLDEGEADEGMFVITTNEGEFLLEFTAEVTREYMNTSIGKIKTINDFANLAKLNWDEALKLFKSPIFENIFHEDARYYHELYHGVTMKGSGGHEMEEFLIGAGKKKRSEFALRPFKNHYEVGNTQVSDTLLIQKSEWGYCDLTITSDSDFLQLTKRHVNNFDFVGKHVEIGFHIQPQALHAGKNFAVITVENCFQQEKITICATRTTDVIRQVRGHKMWEIYSDLEIAFMAYKDGEITKEEWRDQSLSLLREAKSLNPDNRWNNLFAAYIYLQFSDFAGADEEVLTLSRSMRAQRTPLQAFYLYLASFEEDFEEYREVIGRLKEVMTKYPTHPVLNWVCLQFDEALLRNPDRKYQFIKSYMSENSISPIFYQEAAKLVIEYPKLLFAQDAFEYRLIGWMARKNLLTKELALRIQVMAEGKRDFDRNFFRVLTRLYKKYNDESMIKTICVYLIKTNHYGETYFPWFKRGMNMHLRIAGLYEAYMMSWTRSSGELPEEIVKYFSMSSSLPAKRKAMLFAYVVRNKKRLGNDWDAYMVMVRNYALKELSLGHMSDDLGIIYEELRNLLSADQWKEVKYNCEQCYKIHISDARVAAVIVCQPNEDEQPQRVLVSHDSAFIYVAKRPFVILFEDFNGRIYVAKDKYRMSKMLSGDSILGKTEKDETKAVIAAPTSEQSLMELKDSLDAFEGSIDEMDERIRVAKEAGLDILPYCQNLMIRMLFTENFSVHHAWIFEQLLPDPDSLTLRNAYITLLSEKSMLEQLDLPHMVFTYIGNQLKNGYKSNAYCELAFLKEYTKEPNAIWDEIAEKILRKYLLNGHYFDFYTRLPAAFCTRYFLMDLSVITLTADPGHIYRVQCENKERETMVEALPGLYTFPARLLPDEAMNYQIFDEEGVSVMSGTAALPALREEFAKTQFGMLTSLLTHPEDVEARYHYAELLDITELLFQPVKE